jgi:hypothetical protein
VLRVGRYGEEPRDAVSLCCSLDYDAMTNFATTCLLTHLSKKKSGKLWQVSVDSDWFDF